MENIQPKLPIRQRKKGRMQLVTVPDLGGNVVYAAEIMIDGNILLTPQEEYAPKFVFRDGHIVPVRNKFYRDMKALIHEYDEGHLSEEQAEKVSAMIEKAQEAFHSLWVKHKDLLPPDSWRGAKKGCDVE